MNKPNTSSPQTEQKHEGGKIHSSNIPRQHLAINKVLVNLLPPEVLLQRRQSFKLSLANKLSIVALVSLVFFSSVTLAFRLTQNAQMKNAENDLAFATEKINTLKPREQDAILLKGRLESIQKLIGGDDKRKAIFNLVVYLALPNMQISDVSVDPQGGMNISMISRTLESFDDFLSKLSHKETNSGIIQKVYLESLSMGRDGTYRFTLKITPN